MARVFFFVYLGYLGCSSLYVQAQTATSPEQVKRVMVGSFGTRSEAEQIRRSVLEELSRSKKFQTAETPSTADAILSGSGDVFVKGYFSLNPRDRSVGEGAHPIYGGYVSVELKGRNNEVLWSYLVTPRRFGSDEIGRSLARQIVKKLKEAVAH